MDMFELQRRLAAARLYSGKIDGDAGPLTKAAIKALFLQQYVSGYELWALPRRIIAAQQLFCRIDGIEAGAIDGLLGAQTKYAFSVYDARKQSRAAAASIENWRNDESAPQATPSRELVAITSSKVSAPSTKPVWPKQSEAAMNAFFGQKGANQVSLVLPFKMRIAWDLNSSVSKITCNKRVLESLERIFVRALDHYTLPELQRLRLDLFGGCLNVRKMRGGSAWSIHSWGCAVDIDPEHNQLNFHRAQATLDNPPYDPFWRFVYDEGAIGLGRERDYDWMHFQFARL